MTRDEAIRAAHAVTDHEALSAFGALKPLMFRDGGRARRGHWQVQVDGDLFDITVFAEEIPDDPAVWAAYIGPIIEYNDTCDACDGEGRVTRMGRIHSAMLEPPLYTVPCERCDGTGERLRLDCPDEGYDADGHRIYLNAIVAFDDAGTARRVTPGGERF